MKNSNWHGGKGSGRRNSNEQAYADNWDKIFKKEKEVFKQFNSTRKGQDNVEWPERNNINKRESGDKNGTNTGTTDSPSKE